ncbi:MAG: hypothetical protein ACRETN_02840 [Nevskiales bacterium]
MTLTTLAACDRNTAPTTRAPVPVDGAAPAPAKTVPAFNLALPESWKERYRIERIEGSAASNVVPEAILVVEYLYLPAAPELREQPLLMVVVLGQGEWQARQKEEGPPLGDLLTERNGYAYIAALPQANPYGKDGDDAQHYEAMRRDLPAVKASFTLEGA